MRFLLELLRILIIVIFLGGIGWLIIEGFYQVNSQVEAYSWIGAIAIIVLLFIFYRNKLQFSGFYKGRERHKLPKKVTVTLIIVSFLLLLAPFALGTLLG